MSISGHYCPANTEFANQYPCQNGTYNPNSQANSVAACQLCDGGKYCPSLGLSAPAGDCAGGFYCTMGSWSDRPGTVGNDTGADCHCPATSIGGKCKAGTFCPAGSSSPTNCTGGYYCETDELSAVTGPCLAGYYCSLASTMPNPVNETFGDICPKGNYCPLASQAPTPCPEGTFSNAYGNENASNCLPCTGGQYCSGTGRDLPNGNCTGGWFCPPGSNMSEPTGNQCHEGHECPEGSSMETPCASGYYQPSAGQIACLICPAGKYCDQNEAIAEEQSGVGEATHGVVTPKDCPAGFYCPEGTQTSSQYPCPIGTFSNSTGLTNESQCTHCTPGYYCQTPNLVQPTGECLAGYYCTAGATDPNPTSNGDQCPQGSYCVTASPNFVNCPKGTYGGAPQLTALSDCTFCPPGLYCASAGLTAPTGNCSAGYYCSNASEEASPVSKSYGDECPTGSYCPLSSHQPTACPAGTYQPYLRRTGFEDCLSCTPGKYCDQTGMSAVGGDCLQGNLWVYILYCFLIIPLAISV